MTFSIEPFSFFLSTGIEQKRGAACRSPPFFVLSLCFCFQLHLHGGRSVALPRIEQVVKPCAKERSCTARGIDALETNAVLERAERIGADAETEVESDKVRRYGDADAILGDELHADCLPVRHERAVAETDEHAREEKRPALRRDGQT